ncbi:TonB-dependent receptor plug domain-containing protein [bacterium]|nr:TonB-dependent receptor plug domain-containing protein [bacterium]
MSKRFYFPWRLILLLTGFMVHTTAQELEDLMGMSLEDILNIKIYSASKKVEHLFDSPLSSSVITREEIVNSGATNIQEALRLIPGLVVRQQTNGVFDVHIRGLGNLPPNQLFSEAANKISLIMIDNRIVYNYLDGVTFWENLSIDLGDVERIEVVRGPSSALYGPNAVGGVIHIITSRPQKDGMGIHAKAEGGTESTLIGNISAGYKKETWSVRASGHYQKRNRFDSKYFSFIQNEYTELPDSVLSLSMGTMLRGMDKRYPSPDVALDKYGLNAYATYAPNEHVGFDLSTGYAESQSHALYVDIAALNFTTVELISRYINFSARNYGFNEKVAFTSGSQFNNGSSGKPLYYRNLDSDIDYNWEIGRLGMRPGIHYKWSEYDWEDFNQPRSLTTFGMSLRTDYKTDHFRAVAALRGDKYNAPDRWYLSYQLAGQYIVNKANLFRLVVSRANQSAFLANAYFDMSFTIPFAEIGMEMKGNTNLDLMVMDMVELGYRTRPSDKWNLDIEMFMSRSRDFSYLYAAGPPVFRNGLMIFVQEYQNLDLEANQTGVTASAVVLPVSSIKFKMFATVQKTTLDNYAPDLEYPDSTVSKTHRHTPSFFGGFDVVWKPVSSLTVDVNLYYLGSQTYDHADYSFGPFSLVYDMDLKQKPVLNLKTAYMLTSAMQVYLNIRNVLGAEDQEFGYADRLGRLVLGGLVVTY